MPSCFSADGITWTSAAVPATNDILWAGLAYGAGKWVAMQNKTDCRPFYALPPQRKSDDSADHEAEPGAMKTVRELLLGGDPTLFM